MERLTICETDRGRYAVRPMSLAGIWNEKGQIKEDLNHLALFVEKEDAEKFVEWKEEEEQGKLLKLPCAVGDKIWSITSTANYSLGYYSEVPLKHPEEKKIQSITLSKNGCLYHVKGRTYSEFDFGKTVFLTKSAAEQALKEMEGKK